MVSWDLNLSLQVQNLSQTPNSAIKSHINRIANCIVSRKIKKIRTSNSASNGAFLEEAAAELHLCSIHTLCAKCFAHNSWAWRASSAPVPETGDKPGDPSLTHHNEPYPTELAIIYIRFVTFSSPHCSSPTYFWLLNPPGKESEELERS